MRQQHGSVSAGLGKTRAQTGGHPEGHDMAGDPPGDRGRPPGGQQHDVQHALQHAPQPRRSEHTGALAARLWRVRACNRVLLAETGCSRRL